MDKEITERMRKLRKKSKIKLFKFGKKDYPELP